MRPSGWRDSAYRPKLWVMRVATISLAGRACADPSKDRDVRSLLKRHLAEAHVAGTVILDELGLCQGDVRVDVATVNGELTGFEIKSPADSLARWPKQCRVYSKVVDRAWLVAPERTLEAARAPGWWGLIRLVETPHQLGLRVIREAMPNPRPDPYSIACLLWRDEAIEALAQFRLDRGVRTKGRSLIWQRLADELPLDDLRRAVRTALRMRPQRIAELGKNSH
jgi:hypothetical protein